MVVGGALVLLRELRPPGRPMRTGLIVLAAAITLALAAGTLGLGPGRAPAALAWRPISFEARGGIIGQVEFWVSASLISSVGSQILAVFMFLAGAILISGATIANLMRATGAGVATTGRAVRRTTADIAQTAGVRRPATAAARAAAAARASRAAAERVGEPGAGPEAEPEPLFPPEPDTSELVIRATHVEAPPIEGLDGSPGARRPRGRSGPARRGADRRRSGLPGAGRGRQGAPEVDPSQLTPQGRYRAAITDDPDFVWRVPSPAVFDPLHRRGGQARHRRAGGGGPQPARDARPFRDRGQAGRAA